MNQEDIDKAFVSLYDTFLFEFDAKHQKSASQLKEVSKYKRIFALRDNAHVEKDISDHWDGF